MLEGKKKVLTINSMHTRFPLQVYAKADIMLSTEKCHRYKLKSYPKTHRGCHYSK